MPQIPGIWTSLLFVVVALLVANKDWILTNGTLTSVMSSSSSLSDSRAKILLQGDSLTQLAFEGWGAKLANVYQRRADVVARGYGGYNTRMYLQLPIETSFTTGDVALAILFLGANDSGLPKLAAHHHVPVDEYKANLKVLVGRLRKEYKCKEILLIGPPPVQHEQRLKYQVQRYGDKATGVLERTLENTAKYSQACQQAAEEEGLPFVNIFDTMQQETGWDRFFYDGLHFTADGHDFVGNAVVEAIAKAYPHLTVTPDPRTGQFCNSASKCSGLKQGGPFHDEIDNDNVALSFEEHSRKRKNPPADNNDEDGSNKKVS